MAVCAAVAKPCLSQSHPCKKRAPSRRHSQTQFSAAKKGKIKIPRMPPSSRNIPSGMPGWLQRAGRRSPLAPLQFRHGDHPTLGQDESPGSSTKSCRGMVLLQSLPTQTSQPTPSAGEVFAGHALVTVRGKSICRLSASSVPPPLPLRHQPPTKPKGFHGGVLSSEVRECLGRQRCQAR